MNILKFGGSSVSSLDSLQNMIRIIGSYDANEDDALLLVVSALKGVTNDLACTFDLVSKKDTAYKSCFKKIKETHQEFVETMFPANKQIMLRMLLEPIETELESSLSRLYEQEDVGNKDSDVILGFGEIFSAQIIRAYLELNGNQFDYLDARKLIITDDNHGNANVNWRLTIQRINSFFYENSKNYVVTGYIGSTSEGASTTFGRGGSDHTATVFGTVLGTKCVTKWTDVNGIMTADPNRVSNPHSLEKITFSELFSITKFGSNVLVHPNAIVHLSKKNINFLIRNTFNYKFPGTLVCNQSTNANKVLSVNQNCCIVGLKKGYSISKLLLKEIISRDYLFFRLKSYELNGQFESYYVISNEFLHFFNTEAHKLEHELNDFGNLRDAVILYEDISLVTMTSDNMNKVYEINRIDSFLKGRGSQLLMARLFSSAICFIFDTSEVNPTLNFLHEELIEYKEEDLREIG
jgi:aspartate kinase